MARTAYLWSAALLLVGALAVGNPTLRPARPTAVMTPASGSVVVPLVPTLARAATGAIAPASVQLVSHGGAPVDAAALRFDCPDPAIAPLVVAVEIDPVHGAVWVLGDGRRMARGPSSMPPLVKLPRAAAK